MLKSMRLSPLFVLDVKWMVRMHWLQFSSINRRFAFLLQLCDVTLLLQLCDHIDSIVKAHWNLTKRKLNISTQFIHGNWNHLSGMSENAQTLVYRLFDLFQMRMMLLTSFVKCLKVSKLWICICFILPLDVAFARINNGKCSMFTN